MLNQEYSAPASFLGMSSDRLDAVLRARQVDAMLRALPLSALIGVLVAALVMFELRHSVDTLWRGIWFLGVLATNGLRLAFVHWHDSPVLNSVARTQGWHAAAALLAGCSWGVLPFLLPPIQNDFGSIVALLIGAIAVDSLTVYGGNIRLSLMFGLPILLGQAAAFILIPGGSSVSLLLAWLAAGFITLAFGRSIHVANLANRAHGVEVAALVAERDALFESTDRGVLVLRGGLISACNPALEAMFGYVRDELLGKGLDALPVVNHDAGAQGTLEGRRHRLGQVIEVEVSQRSFQSPDGSLVDFVLFNDVSARLRLERDLAADKQRVQNWLDTLPSGLWDFDVRTGRLFNSQRLRTLLGYQADQLLPEPESSRLFFHHDAIHVDDRARVADARMDYLLNGTNFDQQYRLDLNAQGRCWVHETACLLRNEQGEPVRYTGSVTDVSAVNVMQEKLLSSEAFHRHLIEAPNSLIWRADANGVLTYVNELGARELYGYDASEMIGKPLLSFCAPESAREILPRLGAERSGPIRDLEMVHLNKLGRRVYVSINAVPMLDEADGSYAGAMGINTDITYLKRRERAFQDSVRMQRLIFDSAGEGIVMIRNGRIHRANQAFADLVGTTIGDLVARVLSSWFEEPLEWDAVERQLVQLGNVIKVEQQLRRADGRKIWVAVTGRVAGTGEDGRTYIWVFADISARKAQEEQSWYRANHDELTGLPNRRMLQDRFEQSLVRAKRESIRMGVLMLDLDGFKEINDLYGHNAGDEVLRQVANRLIKNVRELDTVARLGGDEFVIVLHQVASSADAELMAARLIEQVRAPIEFGGKVFSVSSSLGMALYPDAGDGIAGLMHAADMAMYAAKASGKDTFRVAQAGGKAIAVRAGRTRPVA